MHFTHVDHLDTIARHGLVADTEVRATGLLAVEVGNHGIKERRRARPVPIAPGGAVGDYVPFYFAARSPMMYVIDRGGVPTYAGGCGELVYLVSTVERLIELGPATVFTDRNAVLAFADFAADPASLDALVDWDLMAARMWNDTPDEPDRKERRMAECLVHRRVPWDAFTEVVAKTQACAESARAVLATVGVATPVVVRPDWYF